MKKIYYIIAITLIVSCNLEKKPDLETSFDNNQQIEFLSNGTWTGFSYGIAGSFILSMEFDQSKATLNFTSAAMSGDKELDIYDIKINNNVLYYYDEESKLWVKYIKIDKYYTEGNSSYLTIYIYVDGEEASIPLEFVRDDLYDFDYQNYMNDFKWESELLSQNAVFIAFADLNSDIFENFKPLNTEENNAETIDFVLPDIETDFDMAITQLLLTMYDSTDNSKASFIDLGFTEEEYKLLENEILKIKANEQTVLSNEIIQISEKIAIDNIIKDLNNYIEINDGLNKEYKVSMKLNFQKNEIEFSVIENNDVKFNFIKSFKLEGKDIYLLNDNSIWEKWRTIEFIDQNNLKLAYFCQFTKQVN